MDQLRAGLRHHITLRHESPGRGLDKARRLEGSLALSRHSTDRLGEQRRCRHLQMFG